MISEIGQTLLSRRGLQLDVSGLGNCAIVPSVLFQFCSMPQHMGGNVHEGQRTKELPVKWGFLHFLLAEATNRRFSRRRVPIRAL